MEKSSLERFGSFMCHCRADQPGILIFTQKIKSPLVIRRGSLETGSDHIINISTDFFKWKKSPSGHWNFYEKKENQVGTLHRRAYGTRGQMGAFNSPFKVERKYENRNDTVFLPICSSSLLFPSIQTLFLNNIVHGWNFQISGLKANYLFSFHKLAGEPQQSLLFTMLLKSDVKLHLVIGNHKRVCALIWCVDTFYDTLGLGLGEHVLYFAFLE